MCNVTADRLHTTESSHSPVLNTVLRIAALSSGYTRYRAGFEPSIVPLEKGNLPVMQPRRAAVISRPISKCVLYTNNRLGQQLFK